MSAARAGGMRRRLIGVFTAITTMVTVAFVVPLALLVRDVAEERALAAAASDAASLAPAVALAGEGPGDLAAALTRTPSGRAGRVTVFLPNGQSIGEGVRSATVERALLSGSVATSTGGAAAEVATPVALSDGAMAAIQVVLPARELARGVRAAWAALCLVGLALVLAGVAVADRLARAVVRPADRLAGAAQLLSAGQLDTRLVVDGPRELASAAAAFNRLAERMTELIHDERELVADLAHRLRTPLTALRLNIDAVRDPAVAERLAADVETLDRTVRSLIDEARRPVRTGGGPTDLVMVAKERLEFWSALAEEQRRRWSLRLPDESAPVALGADELAAMLDVLIENVFAHTPDSTGFAVSLQVDNGWAALTVADEGPGFGELAVLERGRSGGRSTGLGLDIARRTAQAGQGSLELRSGRGGGAVVLRLPIMR
ncbi:MAG: HAMP domain-containing protein [Acidimicrobiales bacterium]